MNQIGKQLTRFIPTGQTAVVQCFYDYKLGVIGANSRVLSLFGVQVTVEEEGWIVIAMD